MGSIGPSTLRDQAEEILPRLDPSLTFVASATGFPAVGVNVLTMLDIQSDHTLKILKPIPIPVKNLLGREGDHLYEVMRGLVRGGKSREMLDEALEAEDRRKRSKEREHEALGQDMNQRLETLAMKRTYVYGKHDSRGGKD